MHRHSLSHLSDPALRHELKARAAAERTATADILAHLAEYDARKLYRPDGYPSMLAYCVAQLRLSEDAAGRRITAARVAQRFPAVLDAVDEGQLNLTAVGLLAPHLTEDSAQELFSAAAGKTKAEIEHLLAVRFPRSEMLTWVAEVPGSSAAGGDDRHALARVEDRRASEVGQVPVALAGIGAEPQCALARVDRSKVRPLSAQSFEVQLTMSRRAHDKLRYLQELLSHQVSSENIAEIVERAFDALIGKLERRKFAAAPKPRTGPLGATASRRHIPAHVRRAVWERDGGRCTFVSESGQRCPARKFIQFDHVLEVARGGEATVQGLRLRCRAHNQYQAECTFGAEFMRRKREEAAEARAAAQAHRAAATAQAAAVRERAAAAARAQAVIAQQPHVQEVVPWLQALGLKATEALGAAIRCADMPDASLEARVRRALTNRVRGVRVERPETGLAPVARPGPLYPASHPS